MMRWVWPVVRPVMRPVSARACMTRPTDQAPGADGLAVGVSLMVAVLVVAAG